MKISPPSSNSRDEYKDCIEAGLYLYVTKHGIKTFYLYKKYKKIQATPLRIKIGRFPEISVSQARMQVQKEKAKLTLGVFEQPYKESITTDTHPSLKEVAEEYFNIRNLKPKTLHEYRRAIENHVSDWMSKPMDKISKEMIITRHRRISKNSGDAMADNVMKVMRSLFSFFKDHHEFAGNNPVKTLSTNRLWKTGIQNRRTRYISHNKLPEWFAIFNQLSHETWRDFIQFTLLTGLRKEEAAKLVWSTIDLDQKFFYIPDTKNSKPHCLPLNTALMKILLRRQKNSNSKWVFPSISNSSNSLYPEAIWRHIFRNHNLKLSTHDLRRSFITIAEGLGIDQLTRKRLMNHKSTGDVTEGYIIHEVDRLRDPSEKIAQAIVTSIDGPLKL